MKVRVARFDFFILLTIVAFSMSSCVSYDQSLLLQEPESGAYNVGPSSAVYKVRLNDLLNISIKSIESDNSDLSNTVTQQNIQVTQLGTGNPQLLFDGYSPDESGNIDVPLIGKVHVLGLTLREIELILEEKLRPYSKFTKVSVSLSNFRITLMGEVNNPGVQYIYEKEYNLLQAIANAGDLSDFANRQKVRLLRQNGNKINSVWLDLTKPEIISSKYFLLQPGDHIYVEPLKAKVNKSNTQNISLGVSVISLAVTLITLFSR